MHSAAHAVVAGSLALLHACLLVTIPANLLLCTTPSLQAPLTQFAKSGSFVSRTHLCRAKIEW